MWMVSFVWQHLLAVIAVHTWELNRLVSKLSYICVREEIIAFRCYFCSPCFLKAYNITWVYSVHFRWFSDVCFITTVYKETYGWTHLSPKARLQNSAASALVMRKLSPWNRPLGKMAFSSASMWLKISDSLVRFRLCRLRIEGECEISYTYLSIHTRLFLGTHNNQKMEK